MSLTGHYQTTMTSHEYGEIIGSLLGLADTMDRYEEAYDDMYGIYGKDRKRGDALREIVTQLKNHTTYIQKEKD